MGSRVTQALVLAPAVLLAAHAAPSNRVGRIFLPATTRLGTESAVALTFDDGPDHALDMFLAVLEKATARATFFVVGEQVERAPSRLREIVSCGHEVAVHCYRHRNHLFLTPNQAVEDMRRARGVVEEATERPTRLFRPPYGRFTLASWLEAGRQGWERVLWTRARDAQDWDAQATPRSVVDNVGWPEAGDILLLHDSDRYFSNAAPGSRGNTVDALPTILERIRASGLKVRPVGELLGLEEHDRLDKGDEAGAGVEARM